MAKEIEAKVREDLLLRKRKHRGQGKALKPLLEEETEESLDLLNETYRLRKNLVFLKSRSCTSFFCFLWVNAFLKCGLMVS